MLTKLHVFIDVNDRISNKTIYFFTYGCDKPITIAHLCSLSLYVSCFYWKGEKKLFRV